MLNNLNKILVIIIIFLLAVFAFSCNKKEYNEKVDETIEEVDLIEDVKNDYSIGSTVKFGTYEQDNIYRNGKEEIEWIIIDKFDGNMMLLSKYVLDFIPYDYNIKVESKLEDNIPCKWENSYIRYWLNNDFYDIAFDESDKKNIINTKVNSGKVYGINNSYIPEDMGKPTDDCVFILSKDEIRNYLGFEINQKSENYLAQYTNYSEYMMNENKIDTDFAIWHKEKQYEDEFNSYAEYWVRSPGVLTTMTDYEYGALIIEKDGHLSNSVCPYCVYKKDENIDKEIIETYKYYYRGVRPVICIKNIFEDISLFNDSYDKVLITTGSDVRKETFNIENVDKAKMICEYDENCGFEMFDTVILGSMEQDNKNNGNEPIEWFVLDKNADKYLLVSKYILGYYEYSNVLDKRVTWEDSSLRAFANNDFFEKTFDEVEKNYIVPVKSINYDNPVFLSIEEKEYIDKVSILSFDECLKYFDISYGECSSDVETDYKKSNSEKLKTVYTEYALNMYKTEPTRSRIARPNDFWLKNQGRSGEEDFRSYNRAMYANETIFLKGYPYDMSDFLTDRGKMTNYKYGFRPTIWVSLSPMATLEK